VRSWVRGVSAARGARSELAFFEMKQPRTEHLSLLVEAYELRFSGQGEATREMPNKYYGGCKHSSFRTICEKGMSEYRCSG
jgi:hypothetical protein